VDAWTTVRYLQPQGRSIRSIAAEMSLARNTVRAALRARTDRRATSVRHDSILNCHPSRSRSGRCCSSRNSLVHACCVGCARWVTKGSATAFCATYRNRRRSPPSYGTGRRTVRDGARRAGPIRLQTVHAEPGRSTGQNDHLLSHTGLQSAQVLPAQLGCDPSLLVWGPGSGFAPRRRRLAHAVGQQRVGTCAGR
jgi:hypothetical protein